MKRTSIFLVLTMVCSVAIGATKICDDTRSNILDVDSNGALAIGTQPTVAQVPWKVAVAAGDVSGWSAVNKFGNNSTADTGDTVWGGDGVYAFFPTNAQSVSAVSTDADDTSGGTGARTVIFYGLDSNWDEINETVTLNGATPVALTNTYIRMFRGVVLTAGSSDNNEGNISVTNGAGTVAIYINALDGQTQHAVYTVPNDKTAMFLKGYVGVSDGGSAVSRESVRFQWQAKPNNGVNGAWATKGEIECVNDGSGWWQYEYAVPVGMLPEKTDIRIIVKTASDQLGVVGGFDLLLKDD